MEPRVSIIIPTYNEGEGITGALDRILGVVTASCEVLVIYDSPDDTTSDHAQRYALSDHRVIPLVNSYGRGPAPAIRFGIDHSRTPVLVVTTADGSDEPELIDELVDLIDQGAVIASPSRYMPGGKQVGGRWPKTLLSRLAGQSLHALAGVATHDATNGFKAYSKDFVRSVGIESAAGWDIALELVAKAHRLRLPIVEIPTTWRERTEGTSNFKLTEWLPKYLYWYIFAFGPRKDLAYFEERVNKARTRAGKDVSSD